MTKLETLKQTVESHFSGLYQSLVIAHDELTLITDTKHVIHLLTELQTHQSCEFNQLIDLCAVDYLRYGKYDWATETVTSSGFSRGVEYNEGTAETVITPRFAVVYHLLSTILNHRLRIKVFLPDSYLVIPSVCSLWKSADWFEREAYDLYGILFEGHPDLRRILTDYGFIGHPFRKDFPISGHVEMRYDAKLEKVIYEPVDIEPRTLVPKVIRDDNRYLNEQEKTHD